MHIRRDEREKIKIKYKKKQEEYQSFDIQAIIDVCFMLLDSFYEKKFNYINSVIIRVSV